MERTRFRATCLSVVVALLGLVAPDAYSGIYSWETSSGLSGDTVPFSPPSSACREPVRRRRAARRVGRGVLGLTG